MAPNDPSSSEAAEAVSPIDNAALEALPPGLRTAAAALAQRCLAEDLVKRIWQRDASAWSDSDEASWLGWLAVEDRPEPAVLDLARQAENAGWKQVLLLGMGGSSLGAEVLEQMLRPEGEAAFELVVLDSTDPERIAAAAERVSPESGAMICASKSGSTLETAILSRHFETLFPPDRCIAVTDPGSALSTHAQQRGWRDVFLGEPQIGGRFSVLSVFGQVPAAASGLPIEAVLRGAAKMRAACERPGFADNPGLVTGVALATAANLGRNKLRLIGDSRWSVFRLWMEQLIAESTGKGGRGIVPVTWCDDDAADVLTVHLVDAGAAAPDDRAEQPVLRVEIGGGVDSQDVAEQLGAEFFRWQFATAVAGALLGINPFDQPDVELAKVKTREITARMLSGESSGAAAPGLRPEEVVDLVAGLAAPNYLGVLLFLPVQGGLEQALGEFAAAVRETSGSSMTWGEGPRYLHSTGQVHKGGPPQGRFLVFSRAASAQARGVRVPEGSDVVPGLHFAAVQAAQAAGDAAALRERGRTVLEVGVEDAAQATAWLQAATAALRRS